MFARDSDKGETHEAVFLSLKMQKHFFSLLDVNALLKQEPSFEAKSVCNFHHYKLLDVMHDYLKDVCSTLTKILA